jgi:hypothetical protein
MRVQPVRDLFAAVGDSRVALKRGDVVPRSFIRLSTATLDNGGSHSGTSRVALSFRRSRFAIAHPAPNIPRRVKNLADAASGLVRRD